MPITIEGKPFSTSSQRRICSPIRRGANSLTKIAVRTPTGSAIAVAIADEQQAADERGCDAAAGLAEERRAFREEVPG